MVKRKMEVGRDLAVPKSGRIILYLFLCLFLMLGGCARMPSQDEIDIGREENARGDLEIIKPPQGLNFEQALTLEDCIRIALENNLELRIRDFEQQIANRETLAQKLRMLPGLTLDGTYQRRDKLRKSDVYNWETEQDQKDFTVSELKDSGKANLSLTWNVLDTLIAHVRGGAAEMREYVLDKRRHRQSQFIALDITEAYWQAVAMEDALDYVHAVDKKLKAVKRAIDASVRDRSLDVMSAKESEMRLKQLELTIRGLQTKLSSSRLKLSQLMGFNQNVQYTLYRPPIKQVIAKLPHTSELNIDRLEEYALTHRPDLFEGDMHVRIQAEEARAAFWKLFPGVNLFAGTHYDHNRLLLSNTWNSVGASLGWNLLDLPARIASLQASGVAVNMAEAQRLLSTVGVITQVHIALLDYAIKVDRFRLLEDTYVISADLLDMAREKSSLGKLKRLDVTQRHLEEMASKLKRDEAVVDLLVAHKRLCVSLGIDPLDCDTSLIGGRGALADTTPVKRWKCTECGYIHTGPYPPDICPICGATRDRFVEYSGDQLNNDLSDWGDREADSGRVMKEEPLTGYRDTVSRAPTSARDRFAGDASNRFLWKVQVGAFKNSGGVDQRLARIGNLGGQLTDPRDTNISTYNHRGKVVNRIRFVGLTEASARQIVQALKAHGMEYWILPPNSAHWQDS